LKHLLLFILITTFFIGCSIKQPEVDIKLSNKSNVDINIKQKTQNVDEEIGVFENIDIIESDISSLDDKESMKIAFIYPSRIVAKYAKSSMNTILAYLDYKKIKFEIKVFDTLNEDDTNIQNAISNARDEGFTNVIALFTPKATTYLHTLDTSALKVYLPLTNKNNITFTNDNFIYGAISYKDQIKKLLEYSSINNTMFYQSSFLGDKIKSLYDSIAFDVKVVKEIKKSKNYYKGIVKDYRIKNSTLFLNTPIIKTSILLSQLRAYNIYPKVILSTQINYNPRILVLTQVKDRSNFVIANSIDKVDDELKDTLDMYGSDVLYNWVDYSTLVGINYLYDHNNSGLIKTEIIDNEVIYEPKLYKTTAYGFLEIK